MLQLLAVPELVPFRLTQQLLSVLTPLIDLRGRGLFRRMLTRLLQALKPHENLLNEMLSVFVLDPALDWTVSFIL